VCLAETETLKVSLHSTEKGLRRICGANKTQKLRFKMEKLSGLFLTFIFISLLASLLVVKVGIPINSNATPTIQPTPAPPLSATNNTNSTKSWHLVDVWKLSVTAVGLSTILISIQPIDCFANFCSEDEEVKEARFKAILYAYKKFKKMFDEFEPCILYLILRLGLILPM
jgi:hypothetical protein